MASRYNRILNDSFVLIPDIKKSSASAMPPTNLLLFLSPNSRLPTDVVFEVYPTSTSTPVRVLAHKCFLANANPVFDKMFFQSGKAREPQGAEVTIQIKNKSEDVFRMFLNHLYGEELVVEDLSSLTSVIQMFELVEQYNVVELKEILLHKMKTQVVEKENFLSVVDLVKGCSGPSEAKDVLEGMLSKYLQVNLGESLAKLATFMSVHEVDNQTLAYLLELSSKIGGEEDKKLDMSVSRLSPDCKREVIVEFLEFSKFPKDQMAKMIDIFIEGIKTDE